MTRIVLPYLISFATSLLGNSVTAIALPLLVLFTTGSPLGAGVVAIAAAVPAALAGILMGSLVDRINRRTAAILSDVISAVALLILPVVDLTVGLDLGWFVAVAIIGSFGDVPGITAREAMLPAIATASGVDPARLIGIREALSGVMLLIGPAVAGVLVATLEPVTVLWVTAGTAALAAGVTLLVPRSATAQVRAVEAGSSVGARHFSPKSLLYGVRQLFRTPVLRSLVMLATVLAVVLAATQGIVIPVHFAFQGEPGYVGFVLSSLAAGLLVGGGTFAIFGPRVRRRTWFAAGLVLLGLGFIGISMLGPVWSVFAAAALVGLGGGCLNAVVGLAFVEQVAETERGRLLGAQNAIITLAPALGIGGAATIIEFGTTQLAAGLLAGIWILAAVIALIVPSLRRIGENGC